MLNILTNHTATYAEHEQHFLDEGHGSGSLARTWWTAELFRWISQRTTAFMPYDLIVLDPPYRLRGNKDRDRKYGDALNQKSWDEWCVWWRAVFGWCHLASKQDAVLILFEYPHNMDILLDMVHVDTDFEFHHDYLLVPHPDSPRYRKRVFYHDHHRQPVSIAERCVIFTKGNAADFFQKQRKDRMRGNVYYHTMQVPGHQCPEFHYNGMKSIEFLESLLTLFLGKTSYPFPILDGFAGSGNVWRAVRNLAQRHGLHCQVESVEQDHDCFLFGNLEELPRKNWIADMEEIHCQVVKHDMPPKEVILDQEVSASTISSYLAIHGCLASEPTLREAVLRRGQLSYHHPDYIGYSHLRFLLQYGKKVTPTLRRVAINRLLETPTLKATAYEKYLQGLVQETQHETQQETISPLS